MSERTEETAAGAIDRVSKYLAERAKLRQADPVDIHGLHVGEDREAVLTTTDLRSILASHERLLAGLKALVDQDCAYNGPDIIIQCDGHSDAIRRVREARAAIQKATA